MKIVLWDTKRSSCRNPFCDPVRATMLPTFLSRVRKDKVSQKPIDATYAFLAAAARLNGHDVEYCEDLAPVADLYILVPALETLGVEFGMIRSLNEARPNLQIWVVGPVADQFADLFLDLNVKIVRGDPRGLALSWAQIDENPGKCVSMNVDRPLNSLLNYPDWDMIRPSVGKGTAEGAKISSCQIPLAKNDSTEFLIEQMDRSNQVYGFRFFHLVDQQWERDGNWVEELVSGLSRRKPKFRFSLPLPADTQRQTLAHLYRQGMRTAEFSVTDQAVNMLDECRSQKLKTSAVFRTCLSEEEEGTEELFELARRLNPHRAKIQVESIPVTQIIRDTLSDMKFAAEFEFQPRREARNRQQFSLWKKQVCRKHVRSELRMVRAA